MAKRKFKEVNFERPKPRKRPGRHTKRPNKKYTKKKKSRTRKIKSF